MDERIFFVRKEEGRDEGYGTEEERSDDSSEDR